MSKTRPLKALKQRYQLDSDQAGNAKGHIYVTSAGLVILEKALDATLTQHLSWWQILIVILILLALAAVSYFDVGGAKYRQTEEEDIQEDEDSEYSDYAPAESPEQRRQMAREALRSSRR